MSKTMYKCGDFKEAIKDFIEVKNVYDIPNNYMWINPHTLEIIYKQSDKNGKERWSYRKFDCDKCINNAGYNILTVNKKSYTLHRLIAKACIPNPDNLSDVLHIDGNKRHNSIENLRWGTHKENMQMWQDSRENRSMIRTIQYRVEKGHMIKDGKKYPMSLEEYIDYRRSQGLRIDALIKKGKEIGILDEDFK